MDKQDEIGEEMEGLQIGENAELTESLSTGSSVDEQEIMAPELVTQGLRQEALEFVEERGFLKPDEIQIAEYGDGIEAGEELDCLMLCGYNTDKVYLVAANEFPEKVDRFIEKMTKWYNRQPNREKLALLPEFLRVGSIVAVYVKKEWKRGRVEEIIPPMETMKKQKEPLYQVLLLDLGELHLVTSSRLCYLHRDFVRKPCWAVKACLPKLEEYYQKYRRAVGALDRRTWGKAVTRKLLGMVFDKPFVVKFHKTVKMEGKGIWEVELLKFSCQNPTGRRKKNVGGGTLEKKAVKTTFPGISFSKDPPDIKGNPDNDWVDNPNFFVKHREYLWLLNLVLFISEINV